MRHAAAVAAAHERPPRHAPTRVACGLALFLALLIPVAASAQAPTSCSATSKVLYVRDALRDLYYWYQFLPALDAARYDTPEAYLDAVRYRPIDRAYSYVADRATTEAFFSDSQFIGLGISTRLESTSFRLLQVFDGSPAAEAGLARGDRVVAIDGRTVASLVQSGQSGAAFGDAIDGLSLDLTVERLDGSSRRIRLAKRVVTIPTVSVTKIFEADGRRIGYIFFRNFVRPSTAALDEAFASLRAAGATELVLDLRYNGGGLVDVAVHLASLIGGTPTAGQLLGRYVHNDKQTSRNRDLRFTTAAEALGLRRLVVVTTPASASASELVINALRPYLPVVVVGDRTYGKPVGQYVLEFCDKVLAPVAFSIRNASDEGDYYDGIPADCPAADDADHALGDPAEASLAEALTVLRTGGCTPAAPAASASPLRERPAAPRETGWQSVVNAW